MQHPILKNTKTIVFYFMGWVLFSIIFFGVFSIFITANRQYLLADIFIQNLLFAGMLMGIWYPIKYMNIETNRPLHLIFNHLLTFFVFSASWLFVSTFLLKLIFPKIEDSGYLEKSLAFKIPFCFFGYFVFVTAIYLMKYYNSYIEKRELETKLNESIRNAELTLLRNQMNPHFIFNSLNSISSLTIIDPEKAHEMVITLADFLRYTVSYGKKQKIALKKELEMCEAYLAIEKIRFGNKIAVEMDVETEALAIEIPSMLLQTLFENAIKHGVYHSLHSEFIYFKATIEQNRLVLRMQNTFDIGGEEKKGTQTGLRNIRERLYLIYGHAALFNTIIEQNHFIVQLNLPITTDENTNFTH